MIPLEVYTVESLESIVKSLLQVALNENDHHSFLAQCSVRNIKVKSWSNNSVFGSYYGYIFSFKWRVKKGILQ